MPTVVVVREARPDELVAAGDVVAAAYLELDPRTAREHHAYLGQIRDAPGRARICPVLVAVDGEGRVVGSVTYVPGPDNPYAEVELAGEAGFRMLGVAPGAQGGGVGRALVQACIERARAEGRSAIAISTRPVMRTARRLYERLGFRRAPERDFAPIPGVELLGYVLEL